MDDYISRAFTQNTRHHTRWSREKQGNASTNLIRFICLQDFVRVAVRSHIGLKLAKTWKPTDKKRLTKRNVVLHFLQDDFQKMNFTKKCQNYHLEILTRGKCFCLVLYWKLLPEHKILERPLYLQLHHSYCFACLFYVFISFSSYYSVTEIGPW